MSVELMHPDGLLRQNDYAPVAVGTGSRLVLLARQAGVAPDFTPAATERSQRIDGLPSPTPPLTVIGVKALFTPDFFVEIEATAILD